MKYTLISCKLEALWLPRSISSLMRQFVYYICAVILLKLCNASNLSVSIETTITCNSYISGTIASSNDIKYHLFDNTIIGNNETLSVLLDLCPSSNASTFDTIIYLYDYELNILNMNDNSNNCNNYQSQLLFKPINNQYLIGIGGSNSEFGTYRMKVSCNNTQKNMNQPTAYHTTNAPSTSSYCFDILLNRYK